MFLFNCSFLIMVCVIFIIRLAKCLCNMWRFIYYVFKGRMFNFKYSIKCIICTIWKYCCWYYIVLVNYILSVTWVQQNLLIIERNNFSFVQKVLCVSLPSTPKNDWPITLTKKIIVVYHVKMNLYYSIYKLFDM